MGVNLTLPRRSRGLVESGNRTFAMRVRDPWIRMVFVLPIGADCVSRCHFALLVTFWVVYSDGSTRRQVSVAKHFLYVSWIFLKGEDLEVQEPVCILSGRSFFLRVLFCSN